MKIKEYNAGDGSLLGWMYWCPACDSVHVVHTNVSNPLTGACWEFNNNLYNPTFTPSVRCQNSRNGVKIICHHFVRNGRIQYLSDCTHEMAGQTVDMLDADIFREWWT